MDKPIDNIIEYTKQIKLQYAAGNTTEHSFRPQLYNLFKSLYPQQYYKITNDPKHIRCGAPDFIIQCKSVPLGYVETKDIIKNLDKLDDREKDQFTRYTESLDNIIYTNYLDFRLYRNQELIKEVSIGGIINGKLQFFKENNQMLAELIQNFVSFNGISITSPELLAKHMARKAREFANSIITVLTSKEDSQFQSSTLQTQYKAFKKVLIENLDPVSFADMYAQAVAYGLFAARLNDPTPDDFSRDEAVHLIPKNNQFLRSLFESITGTYLDPSVEWIVDDLTNLFRHTDLKKLLKTYGQTTAKNDPFTHFYETFLHEYDPDTKQELGVFYTPKPVVNYIVKSIDYILKNELNVNDGLANTDKIPVQIDSIVTEGKIVKGKRKKLKHEKLGKSTIDLHKVQILDPAIGTGTFPAEVIRYVNNQYKTQAGLWADYVKNDLLPRINGFEIMMVPYTICHLKLDMLLQETGYNTASNDARMNIYLTDTLEKSHEETQSLWATFLSDEANQADLVKNYKPIMVVLGNPPYNDNSTNKGEWIMKKMEDYKKEPVTKLPLQERNPKHINDDYLKFIRYAQFLIDRNQEGVVAYINPHGYLDAVTMRGVRYSLLTSFDEIYVLNLHGNTNKGETCPDGSADQNVFDIMQGVCINIFIKKKNHDGNKIATVYYADLYGKRTEKYDFLYANDISTIQWTKVIPQRKNYFMIPINSVAETTETYYSGIQLTELFPINCTGFKTHRDTFAIAISKEEMCQRFYDVISSDVSDEELKLKYNLKETKNWKISDLRSTASTKNLESILTKCNYRPYDFRWCCLSFGFMDRPRKEILDHVLHKENLCIIAPRQQATEGFNHIWISDLPTETCMISTASREANQIFPLYLYSSDTGLFEQKSKRPNIKITALKKFCKLAKLSMVQAESTKKKENQFTPQELVYYIFATLSAEKYSKDYSIYLKSDYPYVPIPKTADAFFSLASLGKELAEIIMMHDITPRINLKTTYPVSGQSNIEKYKYENERIYINDTQYFGNVSAKVWNFVAGGHQPASLWLKHRKGRILTANDIIYYQQMLAAIEKTIELKLKINNTYCRYF